MFEKIKGNFGFGAMRVPMTDKQFDKEKTCEMVDAFINAGFNYFDTAHGYMEGQSERLLRECVVERYPRESVVIADKLSPWFFEKEEEVLPLFEKQLCNCGVEYFDFYLFHTIRDGIYQKHLKCNTFKIVEELKNQGKIKHIAMSFHDSAEFLDKILTEQPMIEAVQLQINYLDYDDPTIQSKACYDVAVKHGKKVIVMEPVRGGLLANLPPEGVAVLEKVYKGSPASFALRYAASYPEVFMVLSGMSDISMVKDNITAMSNFVPLSREEEKTADILREIIRKTRLVPCTKCNYCKDVCPEGLPIPEMFEIFNQFRGAKKERKLVSEELKGYADKLESCIKCGKCEKVCPQKIEIRELIDSMKSV